jgi:hypothetical protein
MDFWYNEDKELSDFEKVWWEMEAIEPLTPTQIPAPYNKIPKRY